MIKVTAIKDRLEEKAEWLAIKARAERRIAEIDAEIKAAEALIQEAAALEKLAQGARA
jgi:hypothetical protein